MHRLPSNADCTIYNEHGTGTNRVMVKHVLLAVWLQEIKGIRQIQAGFESNNSLDLTLTMRVGYVTPQDWQNLTSEEALSGFYYTLKENDRVIRGSKTNAPETITSPVEVDKYFGAEGSYAITSVNENKLPRGATHHFRLLLR